jgi:hypothetical protein
MARSSKPRAPYSPPARFELILTRGGGADLIDRKTGELVWSSREDPDFEAEFPDFLEYDDTADILDYLEDIGELTSEDADQCHIGEEFLTAADFAGLLRDPNMRS